MRVGVIINPVSGGRGHRAGEGGARIDAARQALDALGIDADVAVTERRGHAAELAAAFAAAGVERVVAWGGDGTVNEVAGPLIGTQTVLGIVPSGSGDGLAGGLGLPTRPAEALRVALHGEPDPIDVGMFGARPFLNVAGIGFDAEIAEHFARRARRGVLSYLSIGLSRVWTYRNRVYDIDLDGQRLRGERFVIAFANAPQYGNGLVLERHADPRDGWLNVVIADGGSPLAQLWRGRRLAFRPDAPASGVRRARIRRATVSADEMHCHVDGEPFQTSGTVEILLRPHALLIAGATPSGARAARTSAGTSRSSSTES